MSQPVPAPPPNLGIPESHTTNPWPKQTKPPRFF
jgi:hypothetical protein